MDRSRRPALPRPGLRMPLVVPLRVMFLRDGETKTPLRRMKVTCSIRSESESRNHGMCWRYRCSTFYTHWQMLIRIVKSTHNDQTTRMTCKISSTYAQANPKVAGPSLSNSIQGPLRSSARGDPTRQAHEDKYWQSSVIPSRRIGDTFVKGIIFFIPHPWMASILMLNRESPRESQPRKGIVRETPGVDRGQNTFVFP